MNDMKEARAAMLEAADAMRTALDRLREAAEELDGMDDRDAAAMRETALYAWGRMPLQPVESAAARGRGRKG